MDSCKSSFGDVSHLECNGGEDETLINLCKNSKKRESGTLKNACKYSFGDLFRASHKSASREEEALELKNLYAKSQKERNETVKEWAKECIPSWYVEDQIGDDGILYTAFSPEIN